MVKVTLLNFQGLYPGTNAGRARAADPTGSSRRRQPALSVYCTCMHISAHGLAIYAAQISGLSSPMAQAAAGSSLLPMEGPRLLLQLLLLSQCAPSPDSSQPVTILLHAHCVFSPKVPEPGFV